jgi:hypothetical protein
MCMARASLSVMRPFEVDTMATPKPLSTRGNSSAPEYFRKPGELMRVIFVMAGRFDFES